MLLTLLKGKKAKEPKASTSAQAADGELPPELNFFKYAEGGAPKRKQSGADVESDPKGKKRKVDEDEGEGAEGEGRV